MVKFNFIFIFLFINFFIFSNSLLIPNIIKDINIEAKNGTKIPDVKVKIKNNTFQLKSFFSNTPVILVLVYYKCPMLCEKVLLNLFNSLLKMKDKTLDYNVLVIGFDSNEQDDDIKNMVKKINLKDNPDFLKKWTFLISNDNSSSFLLSSSLGFKYKYDKKIKEFIHSAGIFILNSEMIITSVMWGLEFNDVELFNFLTLSKQNIFSNSKYLLLNCFHYELDKDKYGIYIIFFIKITIFLFLFIFLLLLCKPLINYKKK